MDCDFCSTPINPEKSLDFTVGVGESITTCEQFVKAQASFIDDTTSNDVCENLYEVSVKRGCCECDSNLIEDDDSFLDELMTTSPTMLPATTSSAAGGDRGGGSMCYGYGRSLSSLLLLFSVLVLIV
jgi:hypothetical protein